MQIYTNSLSFTANRHLNVANRALEKSVEGLSSGLRINRSSDDVAGMAVFEKLQIQLKGMAKAATSAQNGISFLQVADSSMGVIGDMLQRMRELAVEAGDATFTANDRRALQAELEQLKADIDRISVETDFNTHKLLSGDASGLWSSSNAGIDVILTGAPAGGNYKLEFSVEPGQNAVYKTNIMPLADANIGYMFSIVSNTSGYMNFNGTGDPRAVNNATIDYCSPSSSSASYLARLLASDGTGMIGYNYHLSSLNLATGATGFYGSITMEFNEDVANVAGNSGTIGFTATDAITGETFSATTTYTYVTGVSTNNIRVHTDGLSLGNALYFNASLLWGAVTSDVTAGNKALFGSAIVAPLQPNVNTNEHLILNVKPVGNSSTLTVNPSVRIEKGIRVIINPNASSGALTVVNIVNGEFVKATVNWYRDFNNPTFSGTVTFGNTIDPLPGTMLKDISHFTDSDGRMLLDNTRKLTLLGNNRTAEIYLGKYDTLQEFNDKLAYAIAITLEMGDPDVEISKLAHIVTAAGSGNDAVKGTIVMQGAMTGRSSEIRFVADEDILRALSIEQIQQSKDDVIEMKVTDAHTGQYVNSDLSIDFMMRGVIKGVNIKLNPNITTSAKMDANGNIAFEQDAGLNPQYIHIANKETGSQIGANAGQYIDISVGRVDTVALEIDDAYLTTLPDAQRALFKIDAAIKNVVQQRAEIGSRINRMEYALKSLSIGQQNVLAASSRIRDIDMAKASADFTKNQIMMNAATSMLAQANQLPQMALQLINR
ncbi:flagellin [Deferribacterales bacterium RsTz2092]